MTEEEISQEELDRRLALATDRAVGKAGAYERLEDSVSKGETVVLSIEEVKRIVELGGDKVALYLESISNWRRKK